MTRALADTLADVERTLGGVEALYDVYAGAVADGGPTIHALNTGDADSAFHTTIQRLVELRDKLRALDRQTARPSTVELRPSPRCGICEGDGFYELGVLADNRAPVSFRALCDCVEIKVARKTESTRCPHAQTRQLDGARRWCAECGTLFRHEPWSPTLAHCLHPNERVDTIPNGAEYCIDCGSWRHESRLGNLWQIPTRVVMGWRQ